MAYRSFSTTEKLYPVRYETLLELFKRKTGIVYNPCAFLFRTRRTGVNISTGVRCAAGGEIRLNRSPLSFEPTVAVPRSRP